MKRRLLQSLASFIIRRAGAIVLVSLFSAAFCAYFTLTHLTVDSNQDHLISEKQEYHKRYLDFLNKFGDHEYIFVVFELTPENTQTSLRAASVLLADLDPALFPYASYKEDLSFTVGQEFQLMPESSLESFRKSIPQLKQLLSLESEAEFYAWITRLIDSLAKSGESQDDDGHFRLIDGALSRILAIYEAPQDPLPSDPWPRSLREQGFYVSETGRLLFVKILPKKDYQSSAVIDEPLKILRTKISNLKREHPGLVVGVTGRPVLQADEIHSTGQDSLYASIASLLGVLLLYLLYLKNLRKPGLIILSLIAGIAWTAFLITVTLGRLNLLSMVFGIILVGIGVDYGMHFLLRYLNYRRDGHSPESALSETMTRVGDSILTGGLATALAFYSAFFCDFLGLQELGFIAGSGVMLCLVSQLVLFPALLYLFSPSDIPQFKLKLPLEALWKYLYLHPKRTLALILGGTLLILPASFKLHFENNLLKLQDPDLDSVQWELKILKDSGMSTYFAAMLASSLEDLEAKKKSVEALLRVASTESILTLIPQASPRRAATISSLRTEVEPLKPGAWRISTTNEVLKQLNEFRETLSRLQDKAFQAGLAEGVDQLDVIINRVQSMQMARSTDDSARIAAINAQLNDLRLKMHHSLNLALKAQAISEKDIPPILRSRYVHEGEYVLYIYPKHNIWDWDELSAFLADLRSIDPAVTGAPVSVYESATRMKQGFYLVGCLTFMIVVFLLYLELRSVEYTVLALIPLIAGLIWLTCWMGLVGLPLHLGNFFALPILIGLGIDNGVHLIHRYRESKNPWDVIATVGPAIFLSTLTTMIGFGALSFVRHLGLASFGQIMTLGSFTCLFAALVLIPSLLSLRKGAP